MGARLRKLGKKGYYYAVFYDGSRTPKEKSIPLHTTLKSAAAKKFGKLADEVEHGRRDPWEDSTLPENLTVRQAADRFLASLTHHRPKTLKAYGSALRTLCGSIPPGLSVSLLSKEHLQRIVNDESVRIPTRRYRYRHLKAFLSWAAASKYIRSNPIEGVKQPKQGERAPEYLTPEQLQMLLRGIEADAEMKAQDGLVMPGEVLWLRDLILLAVGTGCRIGELVNLQWDAVDLQGRFLTVRNTDTFRTKSGSERRIPLAGDALDVLRRLHNNRTDCANGYVLTGKGGGRLCPMYASKRFKYYVRLARLPEYIRFHSLRHTTASWMVMRGVPLSVVQAILGHSSMQVTEKYSHLAPDLLTKAMEATFGNA